MKKTLWILTKSRLCIFNGLIVVSLLLVACTPGRTTEDLPENTSVNTPDREPDSPPLSAAPAYMTALSKALEVCDHVGPDQVCFGQGTIIVKPQPNVKLDEFTKPGDVLDLASVTGLQLSAAASSDNWSVAVMQLQADFNNPEKYLTIVVMGETQLSNIDISVAEDALPLTISGGDESTPQATSEATPIAEPFMLEPLQRFQFSSRPLTDDPTAPPNGLLMWTPPGDESASVIINGVIVTLGSTALVQAQPGGQMTLAMLEGSTLVTTADGQSGIAAGGMQVSIPLDEDGSAHAPVGEIKDPRAEAIAQAVAQYGTEPLDPRAEAIAQAVAQYGPEPLDPRAEAISQAVAQYGIPVDPRAEIISWAAAQYPHEVARDIKTRYRRAIGRCTDPSNPQPRYVYNVLYFYNLIHSTQDPEFLEAFRAARIADLESEARRCLSFELDFDSTSDFVSSKLSYKIHLRADGVKVQFNPDGSLSVKDRQPLKHLTYEVIGGDAPCGRELISPDGTLNVEDGSLKVNSDSLKIVLDVWPDAPAEKVHYSCPYTPFDIVLSWSPLFYFLHKDLSLEPNYRIKDWKNVGTELFAEAIYERSMAMGDGIVTATTFMDLVHTPQR
jgi:hypothetical protein